LGNLTREKVVVVNFGGQYAHLISRRLRNLNVYTEVVPYIRLKDYLSRTDSNSIKAIVLSGGPVSVNELDVNLDDYKDLIGKFPILGICFGHQLLAKVLGGEVRKGKGEFGRCEIRIIKKDVIFNGWSEKEFVWMSHRDYVARLPGNVEVLAVSELGYIAAFKVKDKPIYGVQFHPEVRHTPKGMKLLDNFLNMAKVEKSWSPGNYINEVVKEIRETVEPNAKVLVAVSGGIDSTVTAVLVKKAVGDRLVTALVDHGLFREGEIDEILRNLRSIGINPILIDAKEKFLSRLWGVEDCELRRKIIGEEFAKIFYEIIKSDPSIKYFAQGTTYPDVIESGFEVGADKIKTHHNVAGIPKWFNIKIIEPLKYLYKDEVRRLGKELGVPDEIVKRHPFPGPGLAVRVIGKLTPEKLEIVRKASKILEDELKKEGLYEKVWQAFAVVGDDKWVGVKGDSRDVGYIVTLRIVVSDDAMTADWARIPYDVLDRVARKITSELSNVTMVTYAITSKPPSTIEPC